MNKKKLLFVIDSLRIGGIQTALINLLQVLDYSTYDVTLQLFHYSSEYHDIVPKTVNIRKMPLVMDAMNTSLEDARRKGVWYYLIKIVGSLSCRLLGSNIVYRFLFTLIKQDRTQYDIAISYTNNGGLKGTYYGANLYVLNRISSSRKIAWLHVDYGAMNMSNRINDAEYRRFDRIVHVSKACRESFLKFLPDLRENSIVAYNITDFFRLRKKSGLFNISFDKSVFNIVTVARLDANKNISACLRISERLLNRGLRFMWYIVGDGQDREFIKKYVLSHHLESCIQLIGYQPNPYPYIQNCDIVVSTSLSESFGMVVLESIMLGTPVVAYKYPALEEIIDDGINGIICQDEDAIYDALDRLIVSQCSYQKIKGSCFSKIDLEQMISMNQQALYFN